MIMIYGATLFNALPVSLHQRLLNPFNIPAQAVLLVIIPWMTLRSFHSPWLLVKVLDNCTISLLLHRRIPVVVLFFLIHLLCSVLFVSRHEPVRYWVFSGCFGYRQVLLYVASCYTRLVLLFSLSSHVFAVVLSLLHVSLSRYSLLVVTTFVNTGRFLRFLCRISAPVPLLFRTRLPHVLIFQVGARVYLPSFLLGIYSFSLVRESVRFAICVPRLMCMLRASECRFCWAV